MYFLEKLKNEIAKDANTVLGGEYFSSADFEYPPAEIGGDLSLPCFKLAKILKKNPNEIAEQLVNIKNKWINKAEIKGAYVNFYLKRNSAGQEIIKELQGQTEKNNYANFGRGEKAMLEYVSPNSNKPLHLGHVRNGFLGESLANIMDFCGYGVKRSALINDRGVAICKSMLAYKLWGKGDSPKKSGLKSDHFVGKYYVLFDKKAKEDPKLLEDVQNLLVRWEKGEKEAVGFWKKMNKWATDGYAETYKRLGIRFDKVYRESEIYDDGKKMALEYLEKGIFKKDEKGNVVADLKKCNLPDKIVLRADGTAIYATTDLALAKIRVREGFRKIYYIVGSEQDLYFKQLFCILKQLDIAKGQLNLMENTDLRHLSYGMVELPEGKMKSREGTVVDADDLLNKLEDLLREELKARYELLSHYEIEKRTKSIALAALKFYILNVNPPTTIHFNPKESISFTGKTGPYLLYSYARLHSIWRKGKNKDIYKGADFSLVKEDELWKLILDIAKFPEVLKTALIELNPEKVANYLYEFSAKINDFYHKIPVLEANLPERKIRIAIIDSVLEILKKGFLLLGIEPLEEM
ncbi:MAG: arginine--tRNA ligase [Patescibacteria group bacterium]